MKFRQAILAVTLALLLASTANAFVRVLYVPMQPAQVQPQPMQLVPIVYVSVWRWRARPILGGFVYRRMWVPMAAVPARKEKPE